MCPSFPSPLQLTASDPEGGILARLSSLPLPMTKGDLFCSTTHRGSLYHCRIFGKSEQTADAREMNRTPPQQMDPGRERSSWPRYPLLRPIPSDARLLCVLYQLPRPRNTQYVGGGSVREKQMSPPGRFLLELSCFSSTPRASWSQRRSGLLSCSLLRMWPWYYERPHQLTGTIWSTPR